MTATATAVPANLQYGTRCPAAFGPGRWVEYRGSLGEFHGRSFQIVALMADARLVIENPVTGERLARVRATSVRPLI